MTYCSQDDLQDRLGAEELARLADLDGDGTPDPGVIARALADADATIDSYLGRRYALPVASPDGSTPAVVRTRAMNLAVYFLKLGRDSVTDDVRDQHAEDMRWLERASLGRAALGEAVALPADTGGARVDSRPRLFGRNQPL
jgi:phage gp36-like protein